ncbi:DUF4422 domain-containing protein [Enterobacter cloacae]|uniref:DUF4422 domain-containing protein n=1 Tax=Enterobacter cloacae complex TaxID=354276 RepID=UPI0007952B61|nr:DUF4422 domain-containing protein [Enterobacter cloacae]MCM7397695.1 DUF4422 domain-containing protein [Enterobacter cloacae]MDS0060719.1 DUF4422 domain-containing protein [Enterobacter cloacae subsp. cloacae]MDS0103712.1 DUF4422 domain-containing protein [Enterobacter cloacae subsp. cloacae]MDW8494192.1 DUF4422 domain-containing protein [Enterobacter cloacae subsp. cloacae]QGN43548.1 DUF4422 domain-containing protein [Enterobacter cloacae]
MPLKIYTVSHKEYTFPLHDAYKPLQVGTSKDSIAEKSLRDSTGDNIAHLNSSFCELTAAYWIWKNSQEDIVGLAHYRRYFASSTSNLMVKGKRIASPEEMMNLLQNADILVAKPRNYYITSIKSHYIHAHHESDYTQLRDEIARQQPDYLSDFDDVMGGTKISLYNMFVCKKALIDEYFVWLFPLLFALEQKIAYQNYDAYQKRVFGFMAERLFNVWLHHQRNRLRIKYMPVVNIDGENLLLKGIGLLKRHFWGTK